MTTQNASIDRLKAEVNLLEIAIQNRGRKMDPAMKAKALKRIAELKEIIRQSE